MRIKSCLSTRRKWQLSSLKMMVAARGASFSRASCPKSSPSCSVVTRPCMHTVLSVLDRTDIQFQDIKALHKWQFWDLLFFFFFFYNKKLYLPMCDHVHRAFPDDVPRSAFVPLTEHCTTIRTTNSGYLHTFWVIIIAWKSCLQGMFMWWVERETLTNTQEQTNTHNDFIASTEVTNQSRHEDVWIFSDVMHDLEDNMSDRRVAQKRILGGDLCKSMYGRVFQ